MSQAEALSMLAYFPALSVWQPRLTLAGIDMPQDKVWSIMRRLAGHAIQKDDGCIVWDAAKTRDGYGVLNVWMPGTGKKQFYTHRLSWQLAHGGAAVPHNREIDHKGCDCPECFNPAHLEAATLRNNRQRAGWNTAAKRRAALHTHQEGMQW